MADRVRDRPSNEADPSASDDEAAPSDGADGDEGGGPSRPADGDEDPRAVAADHPVLLFDGVCNLCSGSVQFVVERDPEARFRFAPLQSSVADELLADEPVDPGALDSVVLLEDGEVYRKSEAALRVARHLEGPWSLARHLRVVPRVLRDAVYDLVAGTRYRIFGKKDRCMVPTGDVAERFLATSDGGE